MTQEHKTNRLLIAILSLFLCFSLHAQQKTKSSLEKTMETQGLIDITTLDPSLIIDLRYATSNNFTKKVLYDSLSTPYLHPIAAEKLVKAHQLLKEEYPNYRFLIFDVARPLSVQKKMYEVVQNTPYSAYVANPTRTGLHNYGMAVDLTICDINGMELDMGTPFDYFGSAAGINKEEELINRRVLSRKQVENRKLLRRIMIEAGFLTIRGEWWHFNAISLMHARNSFAVIE